MQPIIILEGFFVGIDVPPPTLDQEEQRLRKECEASFERDRLYVELTSFYARMGLTPPRGN